MSPERDYNALADIFSMIFDREKDIATALRVVFEADSAGRQREKKRKIAAAHIVAHAYLRKLDRGTDLASRRRSSLATRIVGQVAAFHGVTVARLVGDERCGEISRIRHEAMWLLRRERFSFPCIADELGCVNHTSAINGVRKFEARLAADPELRARVLGEQREWRAA